MDIEEVWVWIFKLYQNFVVWCKMVHSIAQPINWYVHNNNNYNYKQTNLIKDNKDKVVLLQFTRYIVTIRTSVIVKE